MIRCPQRGFPAPIMRILLATLMLLAAAIPAAHADKGDVVNGAPATTIAQAKPAASATAEKPAMPAIKPPSPARKRGSGPRNDNADCAWTGKRTVQLLARDDLIAADGFFKFYQAFGCPVPHLGDAFACTVDGLGEAEARELDKRTAACWADPSLTPQPAETAEPEKGAAAPEPAK